MSLAKIPIKYEVPPSAPLPTADVTSSLPTPPAENSTAFYLRGDESWAELSYQALTGIPSAFQPAPHGATHSPNGGSDPIPGIGTGPGGAISYSSLTGIPTTFAPSPHGGTHITTDIIPVAVTGHPGLLPALPSSNANVSFLRGDGTWQAIELPAYAAPPLDECAPPADNTNLNASTLTHGLFPKLSGNSAQVFHGDGTWDVIPFLWSAISGVPLTFSPSPHANSHISLGGDPIPVSTVSSIGSLPKLSGNTTDVLTGTGVWTDWGSVEATWQGGTVSGNINLIGSLITAGLGVSGVTTLSGGLGVSGGATSITGSLGVVGNSTLNGTLTIINSGIRSVILSADVPGLSATTDLEGPYPVIDAFGRVAAGNARHVIEDFTASFGTVNVNQILTLGTNIWASAVSDISASVSSVGSGVGQDAFNKANGVWALNTGSSPSGYAIIYLTPIVPALGGLDIYGRIAFSALATPGSNYVVSFGLSDDLFAYNNTIQLTAPYVGAFNAPGWQGTTIQGGTATNAAAYSGQAPVAFSAGANSFFKLHISIDAAWDNVNFYVNEVLVGNSSTNIPASLAVYPFMGITNVSSGYNQISYIDNFNLDYAYSF